MLPKWQDIPLKGALKLALSQEAWLRAIRREGTLLQVLDEAKVCVAVYVKWELLASYFPQPQKDLPKLFGAIETANLRHSQHFLRSSEGEFPILVFNTNNLSSSGAVVPTGLLVPHRFWEILRKAAN